MPSLPLWNYCIIKKQLNGRIGAFVMVQNSPISYTPSYITVTFKKQTNKQNPVYMCGSVQFINMNEFPCLLFLLIWLPVQFGPQPCPQPLLLLDLLLPMIDFGWQKV